MNTANGSYDAATLLSKGAATADGVAHAVIDTWSRIDRDLAPIVGTAGVAALYRRSLHVCAERHPDLLQAMGPVQRTLDTAPLRSVLLALTPSAAASLGADLLQTFYELLSRMVGPSLTERLTRSVWNDIPGDMPAEDAQA